MESELRALRRENKRLRKQNEYLAHRVDVLSGTARDDARLQIRKKMRLQNASGFWAYNLLRLRSTAAYAIYDKAIFAMRKYVFASNIIFTVKYIVSIVQGSVALVVAAGAFAVALPVLGLITLSAFLADLVLQRRWNRFFRSYLRGKSVYIFFHIRRGRSEKYYIETAKNLGSDAVVLVISESLLTVKNVCVSHLHAESNIFYIYSGYYFILKKLLRSNDLKATAHIY